MRDLSMTPNAIRKRKKKTDPTIHLRDGDRNATYCRRAIFDNQVVIGEIITCTACINNLRKKGGGVVKMTINKQEQWYEEAVKSDQWTSTDFTNGYLAACKKRDEEQREKNARALERLWAIGNRITQDEYETIKSALESV